ncbi:SatD family protein [Yonghaparkia sp. Soil809]|uniref:SatD family protein n=1 Tax=Yonghaparkia sp. Soil809 TaxID=1736417 RepID=UPI0006FCDE03|nr:SatD family protein [Yonghaparkia sp. Soil809]KRF32504.1 hypothetical protein ASG83_00010 [Yonghaparkia sp. Soil809]
MFVIIADQIDSRHDDDRVAGAISEIEHEHGDDLALPPERTAGDELQLLTASAEAALEIALRLLRDEHWRVGIGLGSVRTPLPESVREARGPAFLAARAAVEAADKRPTHCAVRGSSGDEDRVADLGALVDLLLTQRARWSEQGWEMHDLLEGGDTQADAAERIGITPQAASKRARAAGLKLDAEARASLSRLLADADRSQSAIGPTSEDSAA